MTHVRWVGARIERPVDLPALVVAIARLLLAVALVLALFVLRGQLDHQEAIDACRARLVLALSDAQANRDLANDDVTISIGAAVGVEIPYAELPDTFEVLPLSDALGGLIRAELELVGAIKQRTEFERAPTTDCPAAP